MFDDMYIFYENILPKWISNLKRQWNGDVTRFYQERNKWFFFLGVGDDSSITQDPAPIFLKRELRASPWNYFQRSH